MAACNSTRARSGCNREHDGCCAFRFVSGGLPDFDADPSYTVVDIKDAIAHERRNLMRARAILDCLETVLNERDASDEDETDYADVASVAGALVQESIDRLEELA